MQKNKSILGYFLVILSAVIYGIVPLISSIIQGGGIHPFSNVFLRNLLSLPMLAIAAMLGSGKSLKIKPRALPSIAWISLFGCCITPLLLYSSYPMVGTGTATVFHFIYPAAVLIIGLLFLKTRFKILNLVSIAICIAGVFLISAPDSSLNLTGSLIALLSGITYAVYIVWLSCFRYKEISGFVFTFYGSIFCTLVSFIVCLCSGKLTFPDSFEMWFLCVLFALLCNVGAVVLFQVGTQIIGGERSAILSAFEPITSVVVGIAFLNESCGITTIIGSLLVITATVLIAVFDMKDNKKADNS